MKRNSIKNIAMRAAAALCMALISLPSAAQTTVTHPWQGKRVAYFGDSITDPNNKASSTKYWGWLRKWLGITPYVYARSGKQWNDIPRQANLLQKEHADSVDAIIIFIGTNDFNAGVPLGQWFTEADAQVMAGIHEPKHIVTRRQQTLSMTDSTFRGRINIALSTVKKMYPTKQVVLLTPIHRAGFYPSDTNWQPTEDYRNKCGEYIASYVQAVKEAANVWSVPVIDLNALCGLYPLMDEYKQYFNNAETDCLHPNDKGQQRMARTLYYQLLSLPCVF